jgi:hypothetical protein
MFAPIQGQTTIMSTHEERPRRIETESRILEIQYPMQVKQMTKEETKDYHRKKLYDLSLKSLGELAQLDEPTEEQKEWVLHRLKQPVEYWQRWFVGQYFTRQKTAMGLTEKDTSRREIK